MTIEQITVKDKFTVPAMEAFIGFLALPGLGGLFVKSLALCGRDFFNVTFICTVLFCALHGRVIFSFSFCCFNKSGMELLLPLLVQSKRFPLKSDGITHHNNAKNRRSATNIGVIIFRKCQPIKKSCRPWVCTVYETILPPQYMCKINRH